MKRKSADIGAKKTGDKMTEGDLMKDWNLMRYGKPTLMNADIVFTRSNKKLGKLIRNLTTIGNESKSLVNHAGCISKINTKKGVVDLIEALWFVVEHSLKRYFENKELIIIMRNKNLTAAQRKCIVYDIKRRYKGRIYSFTRLTGHLFDKAISKIVRREVTFFAHFGFSFSSICSQAVAVPYAQQEISFGYSPATVDPDQMLDHCFAHPEEWELVYKSPGWSDIIGE